MAFIAAGTTVTATTQTSGSWTPTATGNGFSSATGRYFKIGKLVYVVARWTLPTGNEYSAGSGLGASDSNPFRISGLPFTAANTSNPVLNTTQSHVSINGERLTTNDITVVVYHNTSVIRFFGNRVPYNESSYSTTANNNTGPNTGHEVSVANAFVRSNDDDKKRGGCSFVYYTD